MATLHARQGADNRRPLETLVQGKGRDDKEPVHLHLQTVQALRDYLKAARIADGPVFPSWHHSRSYERLTLRAIHQIVSEAFAEVGIDKTPHGLRHFFTTTFPGSEESLVAAAVEAQCKASTGRDASDSDLTITVKGDAAKVGVRCAGASSGHVDILSKNNGAWAIVFSGQEAPSKEIGLKYALPADWYDQSDN